MTIQVYRPTFQPFAFGGAQVQFASSVRLLFIDGSEIDQCGSILGQECGSRRWGSLE
jgi:hypothetical protein